MNYFTFGTDHDLLHTAVMIKVASFKKKLIKENYIDPLCVGSSIPDNFVACSLAYQKYNKTTAKFRMEHIEDFLPQMVDKGITTLVIADSDYFKSLTKLTKTEPYHGYVCDCAIKDYEHIKVILAPNYHAILYNPTIQEKLDLAIETVRKHIDSAYIEPGSDIIHSADYPMDIVDIDNAIQRLHLYPELVCDVETKGLNFYDCGIKTIGFAWDKHNGVSFPVDRSKLAPRIRQSLKRFFESYQGKLIYHNAGFDMKVLTFNLWMKNLADYKGMLSGIDCITRNFDDTKLITYLATNNTVDTVLKLKLLAQGFAGNFGQDDIDDTDKIDLPDLLQYNLTDCLSTWFVKEKYEPIMIKEGQQDLYHTMFKPSVKTILQMELCGMPINPKKVKIAKFKLTKIVSGHQKFLAASPIIKDFHFGQKQALADKKTAEAKKKIYEVDDPVIARFEFNPGSPTQLVKLIYEYLGYDVIDKTKTKEPATGKKTLKKLINHAKDPEHKEIFEHLIGLAQANKILTSFIPAFETAQRLPDGSYRLYGNFNLGGTQSGRLSSSNPNLQNIPSSSTYAEIIKECFVSVTGWIFCGADFTALEAMTNALQTKDPNKLKVYTDGYDSHCLNAYAYFKDEMPDIDDTVISINSIKKKYKAKRSESKAPTFALQYEGTPQTLMRSLGIGKAKAQQIYDNFHKLYAASDIWTDEQMAMAAINGYVTCAFGLRVRTPILKQTVGGTSSTPYMASEERRSAANSLTQSYGMLNSRAANEFMERVWASPYRYDILPIAQIHDAIYLLIRDDIEIAEWVNRNLIECMQWQELDELEHPTVKIGAELDIFWPNWAKSITLPNLADQKTIRSMCRKAKNEVKLATP